VPESKLFSRVAPFKAGANNHREQPNYYTQGAEKIMGRLKAIWRGFVINAQDFG
jgi:hypothetical protein